MFNQHMIIVSLQTAEFDLFRVDASGYVGRKTVRGKHFAPRKEFDALPVSL